MPIFHCPICNFKSLSEKDEKEHAKTHQKPVSTVLESKKPEEGKRDIRNLDFVKRFLKKNVVLTLKDGITITGILSGFNNYDLMLDEKILIPKHALLIMKEMEPGPVALEG